MNNNDRCSCGAIINRYAIIETKIPYLICYNCKKISPSLPFLGSYVGDVVRNDRLISHRYITEERNCPSCGIKLNAHDFYHELCHGESTESVETFLFEISEIKDLQFMEINT